MGARLVKCISEIVLERVSQYAESELRLKYREMILFRARTNLASYQHVQWPPRKLQPRRSEDYGQIGPSQ